MLHHLTWWYIHCILTALTRFQVTATSEVARALRVAEEAWPELPRSERVKLLLVSGAERLQDQQMTQTARQVAAVHESVGMFSDLYEKHHREKLRDEWPD